MKKTRTKTLGMALACLALAGASSSLFAQSTNCISRFDSDLSALPYGTNYWTSFDTPSLIPFITWTNFGNPAGSMRVDYTWPAAAGIWDWQDAKCSVDPWSSNAPPAGSELDMAKFDYFEMDLYNDTTISQTNDAGGYGGVQIVCQGWSGWGNNDTNGIGWVTLGDASVPTTNGWYHFRCGTTPGITSHGSTLSRLTVNAHVQQNTNRQIQVSLNYDNICFATAGRSPTMGYKKAVRGLNMWTTGTQWARNLFKSRQDGTLYYTWPGCTPATYTFTIASNGFPDFSTVGCTNIFASMMIVGANPAASEGAPDWNEANVVWMQLGWVTNNPSWAFWTFHWKTNWPNENGQYYYASNNVTITNPTPVGKWQLRFNTDTSVTMVAPNGNSSNFVMGVTLSTNGNVIVPDISSVFSVFGNVYYGMFTTDTNAAGLSVIFTEAAFYGNGMNALSNNWGLETASTSWTNDAGNANWEIVGTSPTYFVPAANSWWVNWTIPDGGFGLQTNGTAINVPANWSTNHALVGFPIMERKWVLVKPGDLPASPQMYYRLSKPPY